MLDRRFAGNEPLVAIALIGLCGIVAIVNPIFLSWDNLFGMLRSGMVPLLLALGVLIVIVSGGIDVSFTAVAVVALYVTVRFAGSVSADLPIAVLFLVSAFIGLLLGLVNAVFVARFGLPTLIVTLGTLSLFRGFLLFVVGTEVIRDIPPALTRFSRSALVTTATSGGGTVGLHSGIVVVAVIVVVVWFLLRYSIIGRGVYAIGGNVDAANRSGFNVRGIQYVIYAVVGLLAGVAGMMHGAMVRQASPFDLVGTELDVIAAVVIGGAQLTGGRGTVWGTILGVALIVVMNNSLILLGIPSTWQKVAIGLIILLGTGLPAYRRRRAERLGWTDRSVNV